MNPTPTGEFFYELLTATADLGSRSARLTSDVNAFEQMSLRPPRVNPPELSFYQTVAWLYAYYNEVGRVTIQFLLDKIEGYSVSSSHHWSHKQDVHDLRTVLYHNLNLESPRDTHVQERCDEWFQRRCGSAIPGSDTEWAVCIKALLSESLALVRACVACVRSIERDENLDALREQWRFALRRDYRPHHFHSIVETSASEMGHKHLDAERIVRQYFDQWVRELRNLTADYDFEVEARKLVEQTLTTSVDLPLPITGRDIIRRLGVQPGPEVGKLLRRARDLYRAAPEDGERLLKRLADEEQVQLIDN